jgi:DNA polymerase III epsilon subunit-like protein
MPINRQTILVYDYETGSANPYKTQPIEIACIAIEPRNLEIIPDSEFYSLIKPIQDKEYLEKYNLDDIQPEALKVNKKTIEELSTAPSLKSVWESFTEYVMNFNPTGKKWEAPILSGFNNTGFDDIISNRVAGSDPWKYGPWDEDRQRCSLFHPIHNIDLMKVIFPWFESDFELKSFSLDNLRTRLGMSHEGAHHAMVDVYDTAKILIQFLKLSRKFRKQINW